MVDEHLQRGAEITVAAKPTTNEASSLGLRKRGFGIVDFVEKPTDQEVISRLVANLKVMVKSIDVWRRWEFMSSMLQQCLMHWKDTRDLEKKNSIASGKKISVIYDDYWEDIEPSFFEANLQLYDEFPSLISEQSHL